MVTSKHLLQLFPLFVPASQTPLLHLGNGGSGIGATEIPKQVGDTVKVCACNKLLQQVNSTKKEITRAIPLVFRFKVRCLIFDFYRILLKKYITNVAYPFG